MHLPKLLHDSEVQGISTSQVTCLKWVFPLRELVWHNSLPLVIFCTSRWSTGLGSQSVYFRIVFKSKEEFLVISVWTDIIKLWKGLKNERSQVEVVSVRVICPGKELWQYNGDHKVKKQKPSLGMAKSYGSLDRKGNEVGKQRVGTSRKKSKNYTKLKSGRKVEPSKSDKWKIIFGYCENRISMINCWRA